MSRLKMSHRDEESFGEREQFVDKYETSLFFTNTFWSFPTGNESLVLWVGFIEA
jgi:hypothetical protein